MCLVESGRLAGFGVTDLDIHCIYQDSKFLVSVFFFAGFKLGLWVIWYEQRDMM